MNLAKILEFKKKEVLKSEDFLSFLKTCGMNEKLLPLLEKNKLFVKDDRKKLLENKYLNPIELKKLTNYAGVKKKNEIYLNYTK